MRWDIEHNPYKYLSNNPGNVQASVSQPLVEHLIPTDKLFFKWDVVSLHPLGGAEHKSASFSNPSR